MVSSRWYSSLIMLLCTPNLVSLKCSIFKWFIRITSSILVGWLIMAYANPHIVPLTIFGGYRIRAFFAVCPWYLCAVEACATANDSHRWLPSYVFWIYFHMWTQSRKGYYSFNVSITRLTSEFVHLNKHNWNYLCVSRVILYNALVLYWVNCTHRSII